MSTQKIIGTAIAILTFDSVAIAEEQGNWQDVSGTAIHFESDGIEHSLQPTESGFIRISTDTVELAGDLVGRAVFQPVSVINLVDGSIVNTGSQVFSGTVLESKPVVLHDDDFRFEINLSTGETTGDIFLTNRVSGPIIRCVLQIQGTGRTAEGYNLSNYWGRCKLNGGK